MGRSVDKRRLAEIRELRKNGVEGPERPAPAAQPVAEYSGKPDETEQRIHFERNLIPHGLLGLILGTIGGAGTRLISGEGALDLEKITYAAQSFTLLHASLHQPAYKIYDEMLQQDTEGKKRLPKWITENIHKNWKYGVAESLVGAGAGYELGCMIGYYGLDALIRLF